MIFGMSTEDIYKMNTTNLAYIGDAVYNLIVREMQLACAPDSNTNSLQADSVRYESAKAQARIMKAIFEELSGEEQKLVKRARNRKSASKPKNADPVDYKWATAFEALLGYLYLSGNEDRLDEIVQMAFEKTGDR